MTPKEKAQYIFDRCMFACYECDYTQNAKDCALIAVDEVVAFIDEHMQGWLDWDWKAYWEQVKIEIEKI